jgi:pimeloyl-ACP methyl ester carboxylesterase
MNLQYQVAGEGIPLVLIPGGLTGWLSWEPHAKVLSTKRKVVRVQLLNVQKGLEGRPLPPDYSVKTESRALGATLDELGFSKPLDLVAWSFGAMITLDYALDHPERIRSLILIEPPALWVLRAHGPLDAETQRTVQLLETLHGDITEDQLELFAQNVGFVPPGQPPRSLPQWPLWMRHRFSLRNSPAVVEHTDDVRRLKSFQPHVLLFKGTGSARFLHQIIDRLAAELPHARVVELPGGHAPQIVSMEKFLAELEQFQNTATQ